jgi:molybdate transport system substrate-binding protein
MRLPRPLLICVFSLLSAIAGAAEVRVAVAANFAPALRVLAAEFERQTGHLVVASSASTGKHYAQIVNGAPFDVFLSADVERVERLEAAGLGVAGSRFVYAEGRLALWAPDLDAQSDAIAYLHGDDFRRLSIANPRLAPYGVAAEQVLMAWGLWERVQSRLVRGENVAQALQFVASGSAEIGLVSLSLVLMLDPARQGRFVPIDPGLHQPIRQEALLLRRGEAAESLLAFMRSAATAETLRQLGYLGSGPL